MGLALLAGLGSAVHFDAAEATALLALLLQAVLFAALCAMGYVDGCGVAAVTLLSMALAQRNVACGPSLDPPTVPAAPRRVVLVTGARGRIGAAVVAEMARRGLSILATVRADGQVAATEAALEAALRGTGATASVLPLDVADVSAVRRFAQAAPAHVAALGDGAVLSHVVHCAGVGHDTAGSVAGIDRRLAANAVGPVALTDALRPVLAAGAKATGAKPRVVFVGSSAHRLASLGPAAEQCAALCRGDDAGLEAQLRAYGLSKLCCTQAARALAAQDHGTEYVSVHPGVVRWGGWHDRSLRGAALSLTLVATKTPAEAAAPRPRRPVPCRPPRRPWGHRRRQRRVSLRRPGPPAGWQHPCLLHARRRPHPRLAPCRCRR